MLNICTVILTLFSIRIRIHTHTRTHTGTCFLEITSLYCTITYGVYIRSWPTLLLRASFLNYAGPVITTSIAFYFVTINLFLNNAGSVITISVAFLVCNS
jgi:Na+/melibiose symporter-like transporter